MKQRSSSEKFRHRWKRKSLALLLLVSCLATFVMMESQRARIQMLKLVSPPPRTPKIAFLFITRNRIPLDAVWDAFFRDCDGEDTFSIYVHSRPGFVLTTATTRSTFFLDRQINNSVQEWMIMDSTIPRLVV